MKDSLNIAIAGATGYIGLELIKILSKHPKVKIVYLFANKSAGKSIYTFDKRINLKNLPKISKIKNINWQKINILFTSLPNGEAQKIAKIAPKSVKLIDLSADFRLDNESVYNQNYNYKHSCPELLKEFVYGLFEVNFNLIKNSNKLR